MNPRTVDQHRAPSGAKTDTIDAYLLAKAGWADFADLRRLNPDSELIQELKELTRDQDALIQMQTRLLNQLTTCLKAFYPVSLTLFSKLNQPTTLAFLRLTPTPEQASLLHMEDVEALLKQHRYPGAAAAASRIVTKLKQPALQANQVTTRTKSRLMRAILDQLEPLLKQIAAYDEEIERLFFSMRTTNAFWPCQAQESVWLPACWLRHSFGDKLINISGEPRVRRCAGWFVFLTKVRKGEPHQNGDTSVLPIG